LNKISKEQIIIANNNNNKDYNDEEIDLLGYILVKVERKIYLGLGPI